jgi:hypothetical protein
MSHSLVTYVPAYQLTGWYANIRPEHRDNTTRSDGAEFSSLANVQAFLQATGFVWDSIRPVVRERDDPRLDFYLQPREEQERRLSLGR